MDILKRAPIWLWIVAALVVVTLLFGKFEASVGNVSIGGQDLGGGSVSYDANASSEAAPEQRR